MWPLGVGWGQANAVAVSSQKTYEKHHPLHTSQETDFAVWVQQVNCLLEQKSQQSSEEQKRFQSCTKIIYDVQFSLKSYEIKKVKRKETVRKHPEKKQSIATDPERASMLDLGDNNFKATIIHMFKGKMVVLSKHIENLNRET